MANTQGTKYVFGSPATLNVFNSAGAEIITAVLSPDIESYDITHECDTEEVRNSAGEVVGHIGYNNRLTLTVNFIPSGSSVANAKTAASLPDCNGTAIITGAPVITVGGFADALNSVTGNRWIYAGGASIKTTQTGKATGTITLKKYANISASGAATNL